MTATSVSLVATRLVKHSTVVHDPTANKGKHGRYMLDGIIGHAI